MPAKHFRHIALTGPLAQWVDSHVTEGEYISVSDLIRTPIRLLREKDLTRRADAGAIPASTADNHA